MAEKRIGRRSPTVGSSKIIKGIKIDSVGICKNFNLSWPRTPKNGTCSAYLGRAGYLGASRKKESAVASANCSDKDQMRTNLRLP